MTRIVSILSLLALVLVLASCQSTPTDPASTSSANSALLSKVGGAPQVAMGKSDTAYVMFGNELAGSGYPPPSGHDRSFNGVDRIIPHTVVIPVGGTVVIELHEFHQAAIYDVGTRPEDIAADVESGAATLEDLTAPIFIPDFLIDDPVNRLARSPFVPGGEMMWTTPEGTFDEPGTYLMICDVVPHFFESRMYGYIIVK